MRNSTDSALGIDWPEWAELTLENERERTSKFSTNFRSTQSDLGDAMRLLDVDEWALEDVTGSGGFPGVVVRWRKAGRNYGVACDRYRSKRDNLREAYLWIEETRKREDRPVSTGGDEFAAAQLPPADEDAIAAPAVSADPEPHEVLGVAPDAPEPVVIGAFRELVKEGHADGGGAEEFDVDEIRKARDAMLDG